MKNEKKPITRSVRFQIVIYSLLSILMALASVGGLALLGYGIALAVRPGQPFFFPPEIQWAMLFLAVCFFVLYFLLMMRKTSSYLEEITDGIRAFLKRGFTERIAIRQDNELTEIAESLNRMAADITRMRQEEIQSEQVQKELITNVAHDLRTPLTSVIGYLELLLEKELTKEERRSYLEIAYRKAKRMQTLTDDFFTYTRYGYGESPMQLEELDVVKLLDQLLEEFYPNMQESNLELEVEKQVESVRILADGMLLARAFANLLGNAIKYGRDGKNLLIRMELQEEAGTEWFAVHITNFGEVIPEKDLEHIFERFYRVDAARGEKQGGTGLGLAIVQNIIRRHQGEVHVHSGLDGTCFTVLLPVAAEKKEFKKH